MSEALEKLENTFTEETFTRKPLLNYTVKYFADLSTIINDINSNEDIVSASNIRSKMKENEDISKYLPNDVINNLIRIDYSLFFKLIKSKIITDNNLQDYSDVLSIPKYLRYPLLRRKERYAEDTKKGIDTIIPEGRL